MENNSSDNVIIYKYIFKFSNGTEREFNVKLDKKNLNLIITQRESNPHWTELDNSKCPNCSLDEAQHKFCPIAVNLVEIIDFFRSSLSYEEVDVLIETEARTYMKHISLQSGLSGLIGIYMTTSGCPVMERLKPMVRYHLPFATLEETNYRVLSTYLLAQYFLQRQGKKPDWEFKNLIKMYEAIKIVNENFCKRLLNMNVEDASLNAVVNLDAFADFVPFSITENMLEEMERTFRVYF